MIRSALVSMPLLAGLLLPIAAGANAPQQESQRVWQSADQCAKAAFQQFPDFTTQSNKKREAYRLECLRNHQLPAPTAGSGQ